MTIYMLPGSPVPLARARIHGRHVYDSQSEMKTYLRLFLTKQHGEQPLLAGPLHLYATFFMDMPKRHAKLLDGKFHKYRPDLSNLLKLIEDLATGIVYTDDCQIAEVSCRKIYDQEPKTEFYFELLEDHGKGAFKGE